jgi:hypothetical protein
MAKQTGVWLRPLPASNAKQNVSWHLVALSYELFMRMVDGYVNSVPDFRELQLGRVIGPIHVQATGPN